MSRRADVVCLAWTSNPGRARDLAAALGASPVIVHPRVPRLLRHPLSTAVRYALSLVLTVVALARLRPAAVVAQNPPLFPPLLAAAWARGSGGRFVMDSHPSAFGAKDRRVLARLQRLHRWLARQATAVLVTTEERAAQVDGWGTTGLVVHEPPIPFPPPRPPAQPTVLFAGVFAVDEPVDEVVEAARLLPDVAFRITGRISAAPPGLIEASPPNVEYVGYLATEDYRRAVSEATVLLTLTTEPSSVMRSAYEAVYARVPLVTSDTAVLRDTFPYAGFCDNTATSMAAAVQQVVAASPAARVDAALECQQERWAAQLAGLRAACGLAP